MPYAQEGTGLLHGTAAPPAPTPAERREITEAAAPTLYDRRGRVCNRWCPVCKAGIHANKQGRWRCYGCGARGGEFKGQRLYMTHVPGTPEGKAAAERLAAQT